MKTIIFGPAAAGKTSLMKTTCLGYSFVKVANLKPTKGISRENFIFRGLLELNVWDAGGQTRYLERYFSDSQKPIVFGDIDIAVFMVEAVMDNKKTSLKMREIFDEFLVAVLEYSPLIHKIYVLINKIDLEKSEEDTVYDLLTDGLDPDVLKKCEFTPVSVKSGSAQHRLIEILDSALQNSILEMQKKSVIRASLEKIKEKTNFDLILFNRPDGLVISSTLTGRFETEPLKFLSLQMGSLESNIHSVYSKIMTMAHKDESGPIELSMLVYESETNFVFIKELSDKAVILLISPDKNINYFPAALSEKADLLEIDKQLRIDTF